MHAPDLNEKKEWNKISLIWSAFVSTFREGNYCSSGKKKSTDLHAIKYNCQRCVSVETFICTRDVLWVHCSLFYREVQILYIVRSQIARVFLPKKRETYVPVYTCHEVLWELRLGHQDPLSLYRNNLRVWAGLFTYRPPRLVTVVEILLLISFQSYVIFTTQHQPSVMWYHSRPQICNPFGRATALDPLRWPHGSQLWGREWCQ